jgi:hypothetical protein
MTVKEFYEYCCSKGFENCEIHITYNQTRYPYPMFMNTELTENDILFYYMENNDDSWVQINAIY